MEVTSDAQFRDDPDVIPGWSGWTVRRGGRSGRRPDHAPGWIRGQGPDCFGNDRSSWLGGIPGAPGLGRADLQATPEKLGSFDGGDDAARPRAATEEVGSL